MRYLYRAYCLLYALTLTVWEWNAIYHCPSTSRIARVWTFVLLASGISLILVSSVTAISKVAPNIAIWAITIIWCVSTTWYGWFSAASPFVLRELHTFDSADAVAEAARFDWIHTLLFILFQLFFLSFPIVRRRASWVPQVRTLVRSDEG